MATAAQTPGAGEAVQWLEERIEAAHRDADAHPVASGNRSFYRGQAIAYENIQSFLQNALAAQAPKQGGVGADFDKAWEAYRWNGPGYQDSSPSTAFQAGWDAALAAAPNPPAGEAVGGEMSTIDDQVRIAINTDAEARISRLEASLPFSISKWLTTICAHVIGLYDVSDDPRVRELGVVIKACAADLGEAVSALLPVALTPQTDDLAGLSAEGLRHEASFLLARLRDFEPELTEEQARDWYGHVEPSMSRLQALCVSPANSVPAPAAPQATEDLNGAPRKTPLAPVDDEAVELTASERVSAAQVAYDEWMQDYDPTAPDHEVHLFDAMKAAIAAADAFSTPVPGTAGDLADQDEPVAWAFNIVQGRIPSGTVDLPQLSFVRPDDRNELIRDIEPLYRVVPQARSEDRDEIARHIRSAYRAGLDGDFAVLAADTILSRFAQPAAPQATEEPAADVKPDHEFKSHPSVFWPAATGEKMFEYRRDDRGGYSVGQIVRLRCYAPLTGYVDTPPLDRRITNILRGGDFELPEGFCVLGLAPLYAAPAASRIGVSEEEIALAIADGVGYPYDPSQSDFSEMGDPGPEDWLGGARAALALLAAPRAGGETTAAVGPSEDEIRGNLFAFLCRKYVQRADGRQKSMGLQYTTAETHDLAKEVARFALALLSGQQDRG